MIEVQLVNPNDEPIGSMEKLEAHQKGLLHRAISVLIFNSKGEMLLQRRALKKYHSPGLWTNTCCSHPYPFEIPEDAASRRLNEEMNIESKLNFAFKFIYKTEFSNGLIENELDHVFIGYSDETPHLNTDEAVAFRWVTIKDLQRDIEKNPENYTVWFKIIIEEHLKQVETHLS
ncbi:MAG: isopentenyl-diphosphate Delta-isomerase [Flavobacteriales bacterium]|jgi:isopentenyl-diphosphate delta-isomerase|nr:isopentenyl-diphosphate Delta-isomerase [Flavobacteriales bacterium]